MGSIGEEERRAWFEGMCSTPLLFHALSYKSGVHQTLRGLATQRKKVQTMEHQLKTTQLINIALEELANANTEHLIIAMMCLWRTNLETADRHPTADSLFSAHNPDANWIALYGRMHNVEIHAKALNYLVHRLGGAQALRFPGLLVTVLSL
jgi:hypothetical protein